MNDSPEGTELTDVQKMQIRAAESIGQSFMDAVDSIGSSREIDLAKGSMFDAVMHITKHITR